MKFRDRDESTPEPQDGLDARLTADAETWLQETAPTFTDTPTALLPGVHRVTEDAATAVSAEQDDEPESEPLVSAPGRGAWTRRAPLLVAAAVIALVAAIAIPLVANRSHTAAPAPSAPSPSAPAVPVATPQCPRTDGGPLVDAGSVEPTDGSLVPAEAPVSMLICEYPLPLHPEPRGEGTVGAPFEFDYQDLRDSRTITADLSSVPSDLSRFAVAGGSECSFGSAWSEGMPPPEGSDFRVALSYPSGIIWLSDSTGPDNCAVTTGSGAMSTGTYADLFLRSLKSGTWQPSDRAGVECPYQVDATPYAGTDALPAPKVETDGRLVPPELPAAVVLCGYQKVEPQYQPAAKDVPEFDLPIGFAQQRFELQGDFTSLVAELRSAPPADPSTMRCPAPTDSPTPQLVGLTYGEGAQRQTLWVDARIGATCGLTTNGAVWASGDIPASVQKAMTEKTWLGLKIIDLTPDAPGAMPSAPQTSPGSDVTTSAGIEPSEGWSEAVPAPESLSPEDEECGNIGPSYEGLSKTMIPAGYTSVVVCFGDRVSMPASLVQEINALSDPVDASKCPGGDTVQDMDDIPSLVFLYPDRSPVWLYFYDFCAPLITNGDHEVAAPKAILDQLTKLAGY